MLKICLQLFLLPLVLNVWNQNFLEPMCPVNGNFRCCFIRGFSYIFSFICSVPCFRGTSYAYWKDCLLQLSALFWLFSSLCLFIYIFRSESYSKALFISALQFSDISILFYIAFNLYMGFSSWNVFHLFFCSSFLFYCIQLCLSSIFWYSTLSPLLSYVCSYTSLHLCVCVYSLTLESWNLSGELIKTHIAGTNSRVFYFKVGDKSRIHISNKFQDNISRTSFLESILCIFNYPNLLSNDWPHEHYKKTEKCKIHFILYSFFAVVDMCFTSMNAKIPLYSDYFCFKLWAAFKINFKIYYR